MMIKHGIFDTRSVVQNPGLWKSPPLQPGVGRSTQLCARLLQPRISHVYHFIVSLPGLFSFKNAPLPYPPPPITKHSHCTNKHENAYNGPMRQAKTQNRCPCTQIAWNILPRNSEPSSRPIPTPLPVPDPILLPISTGWHVPSCVEARNSETAELLFLFFLLLKMPHNKRMLKFR